MKNALLMMTMPALVIALMLVGVFTVVGAGYDWAFIGFGVAFTVALSLCEAVPMAIEARH